MQQDCQTIRWMTNPIVFDAEKLDAHTWKLSARGYGWPTGVPDDYGNGVVFAAEADLIDIDDLSGSLAAESPLRTHTRTTTDIPEAGSTNPDNPDRLAIWTDCPHCARKHLLAAYALLTQGQDNDNRVSVGTFRLLLARAEIAITEAQSGDYVGNASLASGCLAAAECIAASKEAVHYTIDSQPLKLDLRLELRDVRLNVDKLNLESAITGLGRLLAEKDIEARAAAHLTEAYRELPSMWEDYLGYFRGGYQHSDRGLLLEMLVSTVREIEETYELGAGSGDPAPLGLNISAASIADANMKLMAATKILLTTPEGRAKVAAFGRVMGAAKKEAKKKRKTNG